MYKKPSKPAKPWWYYDAPTDKQIQAIKNMNRALGSKDTPVPKTKGECAELIKKLKDIIAKNISGCGYIRPRYGPFFPGDDGDDTDDEDEWDCNFEEF